MPASSGARERRSLRLASSSSVGRETVWSMANHPLRSGVSALWYVSILARRSGVANSSDVVAEEDFSVLLWRSASWECVSGELGCEAGCLVDSPSERVQKVLTRWILSFLTGRTAGAGRQREWEWRKGLRMEWTETLLHGSGSASCPRLCLHSGCAPHFIILLYIQRICIYTNYRSRAPCYVGRIIIINLSLPAL